MTTITQFRKEMFKFAEKALEGDVVEFVHKGVRIRLVPEGQRLDKLSRITPLGSSIFAGTAGEFLSANREMSEQVLQDWERKWDKKLGE